MAPKVVVKTKTVVVEEVIEENVVPASEPEDHEEEEYDGEEEEEIDDELSGESVEAVPHPYLYGPDDGEPFVLPKTALELDFPNGIHVTLIGTSHVSIKSVEEVEYVIRKRKPLGAFVEICEERSAMLSQPVRRTEPIAPKSLTAQEYIQAFREGGASKIVQLLISNFYASISEKLKLEITPGAEFAAAAQAMKANGGFVALGDRRVSVTLKRAWHALSTSERAKLLYTLARESFEDIDLEMIEKMKDSDMFTQMFEEMTKELPSIAEPLIYERDRYLAHSLMNCVSKHATLLAHPNSEHLRTREGANHLVAVVGLGHVKGMQRHLEQGLSEEDFANINKVPPPSRFWQFVPSLRTVLGALVGFVVARTAYYFYAYQGEEVSSSSSSSSL